MLGECRRGLACALQTQFPGRQPERIEQAAVSPAVMRRPITADHLGVERIELQADFDQPIDEQPLRVGRGTADMRDQFRLQISDKSTSRRATIADVANSTATKTARVGFNVVWISRQSTHGIY